jgi:CAAX prenyl protease-like protein
VKIALVVAAMAFVWPGYRQYARRVSWLGALVGALGAAAWIGLATWQRGWMPELAERTGIGWLKSLGQRSAFNPMHEIDQLGLAYAFLAVRLFGLAVVVPVIEEFFLRGFVMRFVMRDRWWEVPFGTVSRAAVIAGTLVPILMHPQEAVAALVWFSAVTWLMIRTRSIWDCVLAHAVTNALMGIYVIASGQWWLM